MPTQRKITHTYRIPRRRVLFKKKVRRQPGNPVQMGNGRGGETLHKRGMDTGVTNGKSKTIAKKSRSLFKNHLRLKLEQKQDVAWIFHVIT